MVWLFLVRVAEGRGVQGSKQDRSAEPLVRIVDDDTQVRDALVDFLRSEDIKAVGYSSPDEFLAKDAAARSGCIVLDIHLGNANGLDFQEILVARGNLRPIIVITGAGDIPMTVRAMKAGAVDFLTKPFSDQEFLDAVHVAISRDGAAQQEHAKVEAAEALFNGLTKRERSVMEAIVSGLMNKQIAAKFEISEATVKLHRRNVMHKMEVRSVADLVKKAELLTRAR